MGGFAPRFVVSSLDIRFFSPLWWREEMLRYRLPPEGKRVVLRKAKSGPRWPKNIARWPLPVADHILCKKEGKKQDLHSLNREQFNLYQFCLKPGTLTQWKNKFNEEEPAELLRLTRALFFSHSSTSSSCIRLIYLVGFEGGEWIKCDNERKHGDISLTASVVCHHGFHQWIRCLLTHLYTLMFLKYFFGSSADLKNLSFIAHAYIYLFPYLFYLVYNCQTMDQ